MKRSGYRDVTKQLGKALRMNWAYGVEFIEVDPMVLGIEKFGEDQEAAERAQMMQAERVDKARIRGLHGTAILCRYPIREARLVNTTGSDATPRDLLKTLTDKMGDPEYWTKNAVTYGTGAGMVYSLSTKAYKGSRFQSDPTVAGIKMVATNPEAGLFKSATNFHFDDGTVLDFRGDPKHSFGANRARWRIPTRGGPRNLSGRSSSSAKCGRKGGSSSTGS